MVYLIVAIVWIIGGILAYKYFISKWDDSKFEKIWFSCVWPCLIPLYIIHAIHNS
jgi:hypothetical protein